MPLTMDQETRNKLAQMIEQDIHSREFYLTKKPSTYDYDEDYDVILENLSGALGDLAHYILGKAIIKHPSFAIAAALSICGTVFQSGVTLETITDDPNTIDLNLYIFILSLSGGGKNSYVSSINEIIGDIDERLIIPDPNSSEGLIKNLYTFESRLLVRDEAAEFVKAISSEMSGAHMNRIETALKKLFDKQDKYGAKSSQTTPVPDVMNPRLSVFFASQPATFQSVVNRENIAGGLLSRFIYFQSVEEPASKEKYRAGSRVKAVDHLRKIYANTLLPEGVENREYELSVKYAKQLRTMIDPHTKKLRTNATILSWEEEARVAAQKLFKQCRIEYLRQAKRDEGDPGSLAPLVSRIAMNAVKIAGIHAACRYDFTGKVDPVDFAVGSAIARKNHQFLHVVFADVEIDNSLFLIIDKISRMLTEGKELNCRRLLQSFRNLSRKRLNQCIYEIDYRYDNLEVWFDSHEGFIRLPDDRDVTKVRALRLRPDSLQSLDQV